MKTSRENFKFGEKGKIFPSLDFFPARFFPRSHYVNNAMIIKQRIVDLKISKRGIFFAGKILNSGEKGKFSLARFFPRSYYADQIAITKQRILDLKISKRGKFFFFAGKIFSFSLFFLG